MNTLWWDVEVDFLKKRFPKFKVNRFSDSNLFSFLGKNLLKWVAAVTICNTVFMKDEYFGTDRGANVLVHEGVHVEDWNRWYVLMTISYVLLLPTVFSMRAYWEWRAYKEDLRSTHEQFKHMPLPQYMQIMNSYCEWIAGVFCGSHYFWMFPFRTFMYKKAKKFYLSLQ